MVLLTACTAATGDTATEPDPAEGRAPALDVARALEACAPDAPDEDAGAGVELAGLLAEMVDLSALSRLPRPAYTSAFTSSYDRASDGAEPGENAWFANSDFITLAAGQTATLLDVDGPGVLTRIWSASPQGRVRIVLDGAPEPLVDASFEDLLRGEVPPFTAPFAAVVAFGHNLYFPIPFARSCRITLTGEARSYYHISHRRLPEGTALATLDAESLRASECVRSVVATHLGALHPAQAGRAEGERLSFVLDSARPSRAARIDADPGGSALVELWLWLARPEPELLRSTVLSLELDGSETVRVPVGDFFASGVARDRIESVPIVVEPDGALIARWPMPFESDARIALEAAGAEHTEATLEVVKVAQPFTERSLHFHAQWRPPETLPSEPSSDWNLAHIEGTGLYVGNVLNVINRSPGWWGEGDEKIFVDGETFPSHFGTGTEDYYGYAWCSNEVFSAPYIGQPLATTHRSFGYATLYRFHVLDPIPFSESLRFELEVNHWGEVVDVTYDAVSFWYARPGSRMVGTPATAEQFRVPELGVPEPADVPTGPYRCGG